MKSRELRLHCSTLLHRHPPKTLQEQEVLPLWREEEEEEEEGHTAESVIQTAYAGPSL